MGAGAGKRDFQRAGHSGLTGAPKRLPAVARGEKRMRFDIFLPSVLLLCLAPVFASPTHSEPSPGITGPGRQGEAHAKSDRAKALLHKGEGDRFAANGDYRKAAGEYAMALSLDHTAFSENDKIRMAITLSWAGRLDEALLLLRPIVSKNPKNHDARVHLARVLSWSGRLDEAEREADAILADSPGSLEALLVKANIRRWKGDAGAAAPLYRKILEHHEDFDARLGLAYAYLGAGSSEAADDASAMLRPLTSAQEQELNRLDQALCGARPLQPAARYSRYHDSDRNSADRYSLSSAWRAGSSETEAGYRRVNASAPTRSRSAEEAWVSGRARLHGFGAGAGAGVYQPREGTALGTGYVRLDASTEWGSIGLGASREALSDTALLIDGRIMRQSGTVVVSQNPGRGMTLTETYTRSGYSDDNESDDFLVTAEKRLENFRLLNAAGYRFRYWNFRQQSLGGYFDPEDFSSHQLFTTLRAERNRFHIGLEPAVGIQSFTRFGERNRKGFYSIIASGGWWTKNCGSLEINGERGNYAGGVTPGFAYYLVGFRLKASF